jgi:hypothetical protein
MTLKPEDIESRLLVENSIQEIVSTYEDAFGGDLKNTHFSWVVAFFVSVLSVFAWVLDVDPSLLSATISDLVGLGVALAGVALGLGLAGVAIYISSLKPQTLKLLTQANYPGTSVSALRFILSTFVYVIVAFLRLVVVCVLYYLLFSTNSFVLEFISRQFADPVEFRCAVGLIFLPIYLYYFTFALSNLRSFVLNLHRSILIIAATDLTLYFRDNA